MRITTLMFSLVIISLVAAILSIAVSQVATNYDISYDNSTLATYNQLEAIANTTQEMQEKTESAEKDSTSTDAIAGFFSDAYGALLLTTQSLNLISTMIHTAVTQVTLGETAPYFRTALIALLFIAVFIGVIIKAVTKVDT